jgi:protein SCO1
MLRGAVLGLLLAQALAWPALAQPQPAAGSGGAPAVQRSVRQISLPVGLRLQRADGAVVGLRQALSDGRPVVLSFMYSSCATVCPITNQTLVEFARQLGSDAARVNIVSISIDPDHDSVSKLAEYARRTGNRGSFLTSDPATSEAVQRAFDAWRGDKMNHQPGFFLTRQPDRGWVRLDGLVTPRQLLDEYRRLVGSS